MPVKVTFIGPILPDDQGVNFVRYFPDRETWERVRGFLTGTYAEIKVEIVEKEEIRHVGTRNHY